MINSSEFTPDIFLLGGYRSVYPDKVKQTYFLFFLK